MMQWQWDYSNNTRTEKHKPKRSPVEAAAQNISQQDRAGQASQYSTANDKLNSAQGTDAQFEGPTTSSPFYKSLLATSTDSTSNAYENAKASSTARAKSAGFGYDSPIGAAASRETTGAEAGALAELPAKAMEATAPLQLQAAGQSIAGANASGSMGTAMGNEATSYFGDAVNLENEYQQRRSKFASNLAKVSPIGGAIAGDPSGFANI